MKTISYRTAMALVAALGLGFVGQTLAEHETGAKLKSYKGTVLSLEKDQGVTVRGLVTTRTFQIADDCRMAFDSRENPSRSDLAPGQKISLTYYEHDGVRIARDINQHDRIRTGYITALDADKRRLDVKYAGSTYNFTLAESGVIALNGDKTGGLKDLEVGDSVRVVYQSENEPLIASRVEQKRLNFTGTVRAIDAQTKTVTAKGLLNEKKFHVGSACKIVVNDQVNGSLRDLRIGDKLSVAYDNTDGVLVASRISREPVASDTAAPTVAGEP